MGKGHTGVIITKGDLGFSIGRADGEAEKLGRVLQCEKMTSEGIESTMGPPRAQGITQLR